MNFPFMVVETLHTIATVIPLSYSFIYYIKRKQLKNMHKFENMLFKKWFNGKSYFKHFIVITFNIIHVQDCIATNKSTSEEIWVQCCRRKIIFFSKRGIYDLYDDILMILKLLNIWYWIVWKRFSLVYYTFVINVKWNGESNKTSTQNDFICFSVSEKGSCKSFEAIMSSKLCDIL